MSKIINKKFIRDYTKENLCYISKEELMEILHDSGIEFKKKDSKDVLINLIEKNKLDMWDIYQKVKNNYLGIHPIQLEELLNINKKLRLKMVKDGLLKAAYTKSTRAYGKYLDVPYYSLESLYNLDSNRFGEWKTKNDKPLSKKQLEGIEKAKLTKERKERELALQKERERLISSSELFRHIMTNKDNYIILETNTTGLEYDDQIIEISVIDLNRNILMDTFIYSDKEINPDAALVNGITKEQLKDKPKFKDIELNLSSVLKDKIVLLFNSDFDVEMIRYSGYKEPFKYCCLMEAYQYYCDSVSPISLKDIMDIENIEIKGDFRRSLTKCYCNLDIIEKVDKDIKALLEN